MVNWGWIQLAKGSGPLTLYLNLVGSRVYHKVAQDPGQPVSSATTEPCVTEGASWHWNTTQLCFCQAASCSPWVQLHEDYVERWHLNCGYIGPRPLYQKWRTFLKRWQRPSGEKLGQQMRLLSPFRGTGLLTGSHCCLAVLILKRLYFRQVTLNHHGDKDRDHLINCVFVSFP